METPIPFPAIGSAARQLLGWVAHRPARDGCSVSSAWRCGAWPPTPPPF